MIGDSKERPHARLDVWQDAMDLVEAVYRVSADFPDHERFGLTAQMRRSAVSIPSNIAEGAARRSSAELLRFLSIARGSLAELDTQIQIAIRLRMLDSLESVAPLLDRTFARLNALIRSVATAKSKPTSSLNESPITNHQSRLLNAR